MFILNKDKTYKTLIYPKRKREREEKRKRIQY